jgi:methyl-accepting chemotaxis protein
MALSMFMDATDNDAGVISDRDFLLTVAASVEALIEGLSDRVSLLQQQADHIDSQVHEIRQQADHIDSQVHEIRQFIDEHRPALARGLALVNAGTKLGGWRKRGGDHGED